MQSFWTGPRCPRGQSSSLHEKFHHRPSFPWGARLERTSTDRGWPRLKIARSTVDLRSCPSQAKRWCGRNPPAIPPSNHRGISSPVRQLGNWTLLLHRVHTPTLFPPWVRMLSGRLGCMHRRLSLVLRELNWNCSSLASVSVRSTFFTFECYGLFRLLRSTVSRSNFRTASSYGVWEMQWPLF